MSTPSPDSPAPTADPQHRNLQYYQYYNHGEGTGEEKPVFDTASSGAYADTYRNQAEPRDEGFLEGLAWGSWTGDGLDGGGWGAWDDWRDEDPLEEGGVSAFAGQPLWAGEGQQAGGRKLQDLGSGVNRWGSWGQEGERDYDETCYVKMEKVTPVSGRVFGFVFNCCPISTVECCKVPVVGYVTVCRYQVPFYGSKYHIYNKVSA